MGVPATRQVYRASFIPLRELATRAFSRAAGAPLVPGNKLTLLKDATETYPAWLQTIAGARRTIHFESYIIHDDEAGQKFAEALTQKAHEGVRVRVIYDWMGALGHASRAFWKRLAAAGVEVRCFNPPRIDSPLGWLRRDHRKMLCVDGQFGFVTGLCVGQRWVGNPTKGLAPWRDTGVAIEGPAIADLEMAFGQMWALLGPPISDAELAEIPTPAGDVAVRIVASYPNMAGLYRFDQLISALAQRSIWISDAYFLATAPYVKALTAAAMDGVDVRLLLPNASDAPIVRSLSRAGYRELLEAGVRIFEWDGPMMHAKTAVADGRWARVGSTNLNLASWLGNWELDVVAEDETFAQKLESMYLDDLRHSTEIVMSSKKVVPVEPQLRRWYSRRPATGSARRAFTSAMRVGNTLGAAITSRRALGPSEMSVMAWAAALLLTLAAVAIQWPMAVIVPLVVFSVWVAISLLIRAYRLYRARRAEGKQSDVKPEEVP